MNEQELRAKWQEEAGIYDAWARFVAKQVQGTVADAIRPGSLDVFFKIETKPRLKDPDKLVAKAFHRGKPYKDPYAQIEDKVGIRFVVLLRRELAIVQTAVTSSSHWSYSKDRDFEDEWNSRPDAFDYQALHYVVRSSGPLEYDGTQIPEGIPCEIQIKTLLQHAHSELTHDTLYKPQIEATSQMLRAAAKSMALIEATNDYFETLHDQIEAIVQEQRAITEALSTLYLEIVAEDPVITAHETEINSVYMEEFELHKGNISSFFAEHPELVNAIKSRRGQGLFWKQPSILLVYYLGTKKSRAFLREFPLPKPILKDVWVDLGKNPDPLMR